MNYYNISRVTAIKVVTVGESSCGKTTMVNKLLNPDVKYVPNTTILCSFNLLKINKTQNNDEFCIDIWDTAGQERYAKLIQTYFRDVKIFLMVFDVINYIKTIKTLKSYLVHPDVEECDNIFIIGNKIDFENKLKKNEICSSVHKIELYVKEELQKYTNKNIKYFFISACTNEGLDNLRNEIVRTCSQSLDDNVEQINTLTNKKNTNVKYNDNKNDSINILPVTQLIYNKSENKTFCEKC